MKLQEKDMGDDLELDMSPMIDMVFLLLIFFIVASQIVDEKPQVEIPNAAYGKIDEDQTGRLMITVQKADNELGAKFFIGSSNDDVPIDIVQNEIGRRIELDEELKILIRADSEVDYEVNEQVTRACAAVGAQRLIYSVFEE